MSFNVADLLRAAGGRESSPTRRRPDTGSDRSKGLTALHFLLRKNSDRKHIAMLLGYGAGPTIRNAEGKSPLDMVAHRRDDTLFDLFSKRVPSRRTSQKAR